jgi:hypothetical protein
MLLKELGCKERYEPSTGQREAYSIVEGNTESTMSSISAFIVQEIRALQIFQD